MFDKLKLFVSDKMQALRYRMITEQLYRAGYDESGRFFYYYTFENNTTCYMCTDVYTHYVYMYNINGNWDIYYDPSVNVPISDSGMLYDASMWCTNFVDYTCGRYAEIGAEEDYAIDHNFESTKIPSKDRSDSRVLGMAVNMCRALRINANRLVEFYNSDMDHHTYSNKIMLNNLIKKYNNNLDNMSEEDKAEYDLLTEEINDPSNRIYIKRFNYPKRMKRIEVNDGVGNIYF